MEIKTTGQTTIEGVIYIDSKNVKTHDSDLYEWWGNDKCEKIDLSEEILKAGLSNGEYKIKIILEKTN